MKALFIHIDNKGPAFYRIITPGRALCLRRGWDVTIAQAGQEDLINADDEDVCVMQRHFLPQGLHIIMRKRRAGIPVIGDVDDDYWSLPPFNNSHGTYSNAVICDAEKKLWEGGHMPRTDRLVRTPEILRDFFRMCDAVMVPAMGLGVRIMPLNSRVFVVPNYLNDEIVPEAEWPEPPKMLSHFRVLWTGSTSHVEDIRPLVETAKRLAKVESPKFRFIQLGPFDQLLKNEIPFDSYEYLPPIDNVEDYYRYLSYVPAQVGCAPLRYDTFNKSKSFIKALEYGMTGALPLLQDYGPYKDLPEHGGLLPKVKKNTSEAWYRAIMELASDPERTRLRSEEWQGIVRDRYTIGKNIHRWEEVLNRVIAGGRSSYTPRVLPAVAKTVWEVGDGGVRKVFEEKKADGEAKGAGSVL